MKKNASTATYNITIPPALAGARVDKALADLLAAHSISRARVQALLDAGHVTPAVKANHKVKAGEVFSVHVPAAAEATPQAENIALHIIYEDADVVVVDKPAGMVVHPAAGNHAGTLVNALLAHCGASLSGIGGVKRPGIVHRLDKDTSGLMVVAKHDGAHHGLAAQFANRTLSRTYLALVHGAPPAKLRVETQLARDPKNRQRMAVVKNSGKIAITNMKRIKQLGPYALVECVLETGRTHQIRVHMAHSKFPLIGDKAYGKKTDKLFPRQALHAAGLKFTHPITGKKLSFSSDLPADMAHLLSTIEKP